MAKYLKYEDLQAFMWAIYSDPVGNERVSTFYCIVSCGKSPRTVLLYEQYGAVVVSVLA
jgi:hypothetical protein